MSLTRKYPLTLALSRQGRGDSYTHSPPLTGGDGGEGDVFSCPFVNQQFMTIPAKAGIYTLRMTATASGFPLPVFAGTSLPLRKRGRE